MKLIYTDIFQTQAGDLRIGSYEDKICLCDWIESRKHDLIDRRLCRYFQAECAKGESAMIKSAKVQLLEYFEGERKDFSLPIIFCGSEFQCKVWNELLKVPYGTTISYGELANRIGNPKAVRAVASANASNPISILVPCHRVIGRYHRLIGYGGGLEAKQWLLEHELKNTFTSGLLI